MDKQNLFRQEAINNVKNKYYGSVCVSTPLPYSIVTAGLSLFVIGIIAFMLVAEFSDNYSVTGYLNSNKGIAHVYPTQSGIITRCQAVQGKHVKQGEPLCVINTKYDNLAKHHKQAEFEQLLARQTTIQNDISEKKTHLNALKPLLDKKYIPLQVYEKTYDEMSTLENNQHQITMELIKYKQSQNYVIRAPINGIIANMLYQTGQHVNPNKPLLNIFPDNGHLIAELYVPVSKSGFINKHDPIVIHYDAYPYQHFGAATGTIQSISQTILTDAEESKPIRIGEPYYKITASLDKQTISLYGRARSLQQGMTCSAIIQGARKKIWQWILDPIYRYCGEHLA
ncbi:MAG: HlyD family efflux transporter periplasmic adaptor subunit [Legionellaceae bacterium]|nr:HlyD family efflux transporter periplasmic adaptor subunit [Legionellaceae bacterium]